MEEKNKKDINRRDFIKIVGISAATSTAILYGCSSKGTSSSSSASAEGEIPTDKMTYRTSPTTGDRVSLLGYGCMRWPLKPAPDGKGEVIDQDAVNGLIDYAIAHGVNYFDTSPAYVQGFSEKSTGIALSRYPRDKYFIATKLSNFSPDTWSREASLKFEQYGGYAKLGYDFSSSWKLWGDVNVTHFNASNPGTIQVPLIDNDSRITRGMTSLALENHYEKTSGALSLFYNWGRHKINDGYKTGEQPQTSHFNSKDKMLGISWYQSATFFTGNRLTVGFDYQHFGGESWNKVLATGERKPGVDKQMDEFAGYVDFRQDINSWLSLDAGVRVDHHSHVGTEWIPQGGLAFHLPKSAELKAMVSKGYRNPTIREMYMFAPANPKLNPEKLVSYELSYSQRLLEDALYYGLNLYYINGDNVIMSNGLTPPLNVNSGEIENWGIEANIGYRFNSHWNVNANYSWLHMENPVLAAPEHKLYVGADYTAGRWTVSTGMQYIKGLYTSVIVNNKGTEQQDSFVLWNLRGNYRVCNFANIFVKGENLLAQRYEINAGYPMPKATFMGGINLNF